MLLKGYFILVGRVGHMSGPIGLWSSFL